MIDEVKLWLRLRYSTAAAAIKALRYHGMDIHDDAREDVREGDSVRGGEERVHADQVHAAAKELEEALEHAQTSKRNDPEQEHPPDDDTA